MEMDIPVEMSCKCGGTLEASGDTLTDDSVVTCKSCGATIGTWAEVKEHATEVAAEQIKKHMADALGDAFKIS